MDTNKRIARTVGVLYIIGTVSGILSVVFSRNVQKLIYAKNLLLAKNLDWTGIAPQVG